MCLEAWVSENYFQVGYTEGSSSMLFPPQNSTSWLSRHLASAPEEDRHPKQGHESGHFQVLFNKDLGKQGLKACG